MPNISIFTDKDDIKRIIQFLNEDSDVGYMIDVGEGLDGKRKWKVVSEVSFLKDGYYQIWHIPSGKLIVEGEKRIDPDWIEVNNPFEIFEAYPYNNNWDIQNTGNHPQFFVLDIRTSINDHEFGLTSISWIGSRYTKPNVCTKEFWRKLRSFINKNSIEPEPGIIDRHHLPNFKTFKSAAKILNS